MSNSNHFDGSQTNLVLQGAEQDTERHSTLISNLTAEVEHGNGCALKGALRAMPFEESLKTLRDIEVKNKTDRSEDPSIPAVFFLSSGEGSESYGKLFSPAGPHWWDGYNTLIQDSLSVRGTSSNNLGDRSIVCIDATKSSKAPDR